MIYRKAKLSDVPEIVEIAVLSVSIDPFPVNISRKAMADTVQACINPAHFVWVAEDDGKVVAAVVACVQQSFWYEKMSCSVLLYFTTVKGAGLPLIREFARWVKSRSGIKVAEFTLEPNVDPRLLKVLRRIGFTRQSISLSYVRGM